MLDLIVGPLVDLVKEKAVDLLKDQYERRSDVEDKLNKIVDGLKRIEAVANTADDEDLEKHEPLKAWTGTLKAAAEEARDVLDEFEYLRLERERQAEEEGADDVAVPDKRLKTPFGYISSIYKSVKKRFFGSTEQLERLSMTLSKLEELASSTGQFLQLVENRKATDREHHKHDDGGILETTSSVVERNWIGRQDELKNIINKLLEEEPPVSDGGRIPVLAVVGLGGMGKTTLAQHVMNNPKVESHFDVRMWAYVSQVFHVPTLTKKILESAAPNMTCSHTESLETLQQKLKDALKSKRFLLVLDDLWYDQNNKFTMEEEWNKLCSPLAEAGGKGSKILLTSRTPEVKDLPGPPAPMILQGLDPDECWSIIQRCAFRGDGNLDSYQHLVEVGKKIAHKVQGSPLAAKALGGILRKKLDLRHWSKILNSELSKIGENDLMPVLKLSYRHLPPPLRQCFAYCSLFPKGHNFDVDELVRMWVAHGYIRDRTNGEDTEENMGRRYFDYLLSAGFFTRQFHFGWKFVMHDLMNDLARFVSKDEFLCIDDECDIPDTVRHLSLGKTDYLPNLSKKGCILSNLQTLIITPHYYGDVDGEVGDVDEEVVKDVLHQLRRVRVLDLMCCRMKELPDDIGGLVHLRYLTLSYTGIFRLSRLPEWLWRLYHLQVLNIYRKYHEEMLLEKLNHLVKLRFLNAGDDNLKLSWIKGLKSLQVLSMGLVVEKGRGGEIVNLKALNELREELILNHLDYVESGATAREADLCRKKWLQKLKLSWRRGADCSPAAAADVLEGLQPPSSLEQLRIFNYPGMVCPNWMSNLWLTNLQSLHLANMHRVRKLSLEGFPSLKSLKIDGMKELEEWNGSGWFPCLEVLEIRNCPKIMELPTLAPTLTVLSITDLTSLRGEGLLQNLHHLRNLKKLTIFCCKLLVSLPDWGFVDLISLKSLEIRSCPNLTCVAPKQDLGRGLLPSSLGELNLSDLCDETLSRFLHGLSNLSILLLSSCPYLKSMPSREELADLTSLQKLLIRDCESLTPSGLENLPALPSLKWLRIYNCPMLVSPSGPEDLHAQASLKKVEIKLCLGGDGEGTSRGRFSLTLKILEIDDPLMLINVPVLNSLTSVQQVTITDASQLISFPPELERWFLQNGTSLKVLTIDSDRALKLQALPDLPKSLDRLEIYSPNEKFKKRYERDIGPDWHKIQHIKHIDIQRRWW